MNDLSGAPAPSTAPELGGVADFVDTNGWHTVAAVTYEELNSAIKATSSHPGSFTMSATDGSASATGNFGDWELTTGGAGPDIVMKIAITGGSLTGPFGAQGQQATLTVQPCAYPVTVNAAFIPHTASQSIEDLLIDPNTPVEVGPALNGVSPTGKFLADAEYRQLLQEWLTANIGDFSVLFASVDLDAAYEQAGQAWLRPSFKGYAVAEPPIGATLQNSVFAVLCLVDGTAAPSNIAYAVSPDAIPTGAAASFLISSDRFLQHMLLPAMPLLFQGIGNDPPEQHFGIDNDGSRIRNLQDLTANSLELDNGKSVDPSIAASSFTLQVDRNELVIGIEDMTFEPAASVTMHLTYSGRQEVVFDKTKGILDLKTTEQSSSGSIEIGEGLQIAEYVLGAISMVTAAVAGAGKAASESATAAINSSSSATITSVASFGEDEEVAQQVTISAVGGLLKGTPAQMAVWAARFKSIAWIGLIGSILSAVTPIAKEIFEHVEKGEWDKLPKVGDFVDAAVGKTVHWPTIAGTFALDSARLAGCLQFGLVKRS